MADKKNKRTQYEDQLGEADRIILDLLGKSKEPLSTYDIAKKSKITWLTVKAHCYKLMALGMIDNEAEASRLGMKKVMWRMVK